MNPTIASTPHIAPFVERVNARDVPTLDYEEGGSILNVESGAGVEWTAEIISSSSIVVYRDGVAPVTVVADFPITEVSLALDAANRPHIAYVAGGIAKLYYYNSLSTVFETMEIAGARTPRICTDEKTPAFTADRDIVLTYLIGDTLYTRLERDRFTIEYNKGVTEVPGLDIVSFGMNTGRCLQWRFI